MSNVTAIQPQTYTLDDKTTLALVAGGDTSKLTDPQRIAYYKARCEASGLDPRTQPFEFIRFQGKEILYAKKAASDGLAAKHGIKLTITDQRTEEGIRLVTVRAETSDGRVTEEIGALPVAGLKGGDLANALMKCVTKAKRRAVLSVTGLGMLDETEVADAPQTIETKPPPAAALPPAPQPTATPTPSPQPTTKAAPPAYVLALWKKIRAEWGDAASDRLKSAAESLWGDRAKPSAEWSLFDAQEIERVLWPATDVPF